MNVQANRTKKINKMNFYITQSLDCNPFQIYHTQKRYRTI